MTGFRSHNCCVVELDVDLGLLTPRSTCLHIESWGPEESEGEQCSLGWFMLSTGRQLQGGERRHAGGHKCPDLSVLSLLPTASPMESTLRETVSWTPARFSFSGLHLLPHLNSILPQVISVT